MGGGHVQCYDCKTKSIRAPTRSVLDANTTGQKRTVTLRMWDDEDV